MPRGRPKKEVKPRDPSKVVQRWTPKKWAEEKYGEKGARAILAAGADFSKRVTKAHADIQKERELEGRILRTRTLLEKLTAARMTGNKLMDMEECEKILTGIVNTLPEVVEKPKPEPEPKPEEVKA